MDRDLSINKTADVTEQDFVCATNGYIDIIAISGDQPLRYFEGGLHPIDEYKPLELDE